jgi:hypothetical protein
MSDDWRPRSADVLVLLIQAYLPYVPWLLEHVGGAWRVTTGSRPRCPARRPGTGHRVT